MDEHKNLAFSILDNAPGTGGTSLEVADVVTLVRSVRTWDSVRGMLRRPHVIMAGAPATDRGEIRVRIGAGQSSLSLHEVAVLL